MEEKRINCWGWKTQIADCRFRPLNQLYDNYNPMAIAQTNDDYFISNQWTDQLVKQFRKNVRRQNICVRMGYEFYSKTGERKKIAKEEFAKFKEQKSIKEKTQYLESMGIDWWSPAKVSFQ
jgi:hypothetical protein